MKTHYCRRVSGRVQSSKQQCPWNCPEMDTTDDQ